MGPDGYGSIAHLYSVQLLTVDLTPVQLKLLDRALLLYEPEDAQLDHDLADLLRKFNVLSQRYGRSA